MKEMINEKSNSKVILISGERKSIFFVMLGSLFVILLTLFSSAYSNLEINSTNYSGFPTQGSSSGNLTSGNYSGDSASFYQQAIGYLNDLLFSGVHGFSFNVSAPTGNSPSLSLAKPSNTTYITRINLPLNFTVSNALYIWYNLDSGANTTIIGNTTFNTTNGLHTLYLYANNTYGNSSANVTFTADTSKLLVVYNNYTGSTKGSSTNFNASPYEELQNLDNITLENTNYGKIVFNTEINVTNDSDVSDSETNIDLYTNISSNSIGINSTALPNFNKSATVYLYGLTFTDPRILRDGSVCPDTICTEVSYTGGTFAFSVTQFTTYSAEETPAGGTAAPSGGGPSGGGAVAGTVSGATFTLDKSQISVSLTPGQVKTENITLTNSGTQIITVRIENLITDFVMRGEEIVILNPGESRTIPIYVLARVDTIPNLYLGKLIVSSGSTRKEVFMAVEVESGGALLDVNAKVERAYEEILPGTPVLAKITLFNLGGSGRKDVKIEYIVKDYNGKVIANESESLAIETQITFLREVHIPEDAGIGNYVLYVKVTTEEGKVASSTDSFKIVSSKVTSREKIYIVIIVILAVILSLIIYFTTLRIGTRATKRGASKKTEERVSLRSIMKK